MDNETETKIELVGSATQMESLAFVKQPKELTLIGTSLRGAKEKEVSIDIKFAPAKNESEQVAYQTRLIHAMELKSDIEQKFMMRRFKIAKPQYVENATVRCGIIIPADHPLNDIEAIVNEVIANDKSDIMASIRTKLEPHVRPSKPNQRPSSPRQK